MMDQAASTQPWWLRAPGQRPAWQRWLLLIAAIGAPVAVGLRFSDPLGTPLGQTPALAFIAVAAWFGGASTGLLAVTSVILSTGFSFSLGPALNDWLPVLRTEAETMLLFLAIAGAGALMCGALHQRLSTAFDRLETRRADLSRRLARACAARSERSAVIVSQPGGTVVEAQGWESLTGSPDPIGAHEDWIAHVHPRDQAVVRAALEVSPSTAQPLAATCRLRTSDRGDRFVSVQRVLIHNPDGAVCERVDAIFDCHESTLARLAAERHAGEWREIFENLPVLVAVIDAQGRIRFANQLYRKWFGTDGETRGQGAGGTCGIEAAAAVQEDLHRALGGGTSHRERPLRDAHETWRWIESTCVPRLDESGRAIGCLWVAEDVTERKHFEAERLQTAQQSASRSAGVPDSAWTVRGGGSLG